MNLLNSLYTIDIPKHNKNPKMRPHKLDNISLAFQMIENAKIKTNFLKPAHLVDHDLKMILGMIWAIILDFQIKGISVDELTAKEGLLLWCQKKTAGYRDVKVENFTSSWTNGLAFCALIHRHRPDLLDYDPLDKANGKQNLELAFSIAEKHLGIPRLLDVEDIADMPKPDERSIMTYVSEFFHAFASQDIKEIAARRIQKFVQFTQSMESMQSEYEGGAKDLLSWIASAQERMNNRTFDDSYENAKALFDAHKEYMVNEKPKKAAVKLDLEALYANIQTKLRVNGRSGYQVPSGLSTDDIEVVWEALSNAEKERGKAVRDNIFRFITTVQTTVSDQQIREFGEAFDHFNPDRSGFITKNEFKACLSSLSIPFKEDEAFNQAFLKATGGADKISKEQFIQYMIGFVEDKDTPDQIKGSFRILADNSNSISAPQLNIRPLVENEISYLTSKMPPAAGGAVYDYNTYTDTAFHV